MAACTAQPAETTAPAVSATEPGAEPETTAAPTQPQETDLYLRAAEELTGRKDVTMELLVTTITTVDGDQYSEQSAQTLTHKGTGTDNALIVLEEEIAFGVHGQQDVSEETETVQYTETWYQDMVYAQLLGVCCFCSPVSAEEAAERYIPLALLDADLYGSVTREETAEGTLLTFTQPSAAENWAMPEEAQMVEASGTALIDDQGTLAEMTYSLRYTYGPAEYSLEVTSSPWDTLRMVTAPASPDSYGQIQYLDALRMSVSVPAKLVQTDSTITSSLESMYCEAAAVMRNQSTVVNVHGRLEETKAKVETGIYFMDYSNGQSEEYDLEETYLDGTLTNVEDDGQPSTYDSISWEMMRAYVAGLMLYGMLDMEYWQDVTATDMGSVCLLEYQMNEAFGNAIQDSICEMLWGDPDFLMNLASSYENVDLKGYLSVDKYTGLPVAAGYYYEGAHILDGDKYLLTLQYDQSIEAPAKGAYQEITGQMPAEEEPEQMATPLFYHVTGDDGQEMWLFGTIHVGDERTAYLPEEIYNAFAASDALALECDTEAFDKKLEEDDALAQQVSGLYFYSGGLSSIKGLMEEEEYDHALRLLKAVGGYNVNMTYAKPYVWSSTIDQFYLRQGYQLHNDQGVEERLVDWAQELEKPILEVESSLFQIKMLTGFSNDLQLLMLRESVETSSLDYNEGTMELFEKWCAGDEAVLREELSDEVNLEELTEEELAEYEEQKHLLEEYNQAMSYDRNEGMLEKAVEYLESGDVVFYAVGLAHLLNNVNGLVDALRDAGYTVELVTYGS